MPNFWDYTQDAVTNSWTEVGNTTVANTQLKVTHAAQANSHHVVFHCDASYSSSTGVGLLQIKFGEAVVASKEIFGAGRIDFAFKGRANPTCNQSITAVLSPGGALIHGYLTLVGFTTGFTETGPGVPFDPSQLSGIVLWLRADSMTAADGAAVTTWPDQSGKGHDATGAGAARPSYQNNEPLLTGYPSCHFDGGDDVMTGAFTEFPTITSAVNIFCVVKFDATDLVRGVIDVAINAVDTGTCLFVNANTLKDRRGTVANEATVAFVETAKAHIISATSTNALREIFLDGVTQNSSAVAKSMVVIPSAYSLGARYGGGTMSGYIAELIVSTGGWGQRTQVETYLARKYNLPIT